MKNLMRFNFVIVLLFFASFSSKAQLAIGGGLAFGTDIESLGITLKGNYLFAEEWEGSGSFTYFFPKNENDFLDINLWEFNADAHYIIVSNEKFTFYPLAGLSVAGVTFDFNNLGNNPFFTGVDGTSTEVGLNIGAGGTLIFSEKLSGFAEAKYVIGGFDQLVGNLGILFQIGNKSN